MTLVSYFLAIIALLLIAISMIKKNKTIDESFRKDRW